MYIVHVCHIHDVYIHVHVYSHPKNEVHICTCIYVCMKRTCTNHAGISLTYTKLHTNTY